MKRLTAWRREGQAISMQVVIGEPRYLRTSPTMAMSKKLMEILRFKKKNKQQGDVYLDVQLVSAHCFTPERLAKHHLWWGYSCLQFLKTGDVMGSQFILQTMLGLGDNCSIEIFGTCRTCLIQVCNPKAPSCAQVLRWNPAHRWAIMPQKIGSVLKDPIFHLNSWNQDEPRNQWFRMGRWMWWLQCHLEMTIGKPCSKITK